MDFFFKAYFSEQRKWWLKGAKLAPQLVSVGIVAANGNTYEAVSSEICLKNLDEALKTSLPPKQTEPWKRPGAIRKEIQRFVAFHDDGKPNRFFGYESHKDQIFFNEIWNARLLIDLNQKEVLSALEKGAHLLGNHDYLLQPIEAETLGPEDLLEITQSHISYPERRENLSALEFAEWVYKLHLFLMLNGESEALAEEATSED